MNQNNMHCNQEDSYSSHYRKDMSKITFCKSFWLLEVNEVIYFDFNFLEVLSGVLMGILFPHTSSIESLGKSIVNTPFSNDA